MSIEHYKKRYFVSSSKVFRIKKKELWDLISSPGVLKLCHPFCKSNEVIHWGPDNYSDELIYLNDLKYIRKFQNWNPLEGYDLLIGKLNGLQSYVLWELNELDKNNCSLKITVFPYLFTNLGKVFSFLPFMLYVKPRLKKYLNSVLSGFEYYLLNDEEVPRNCFGKHKWFS